ncbi:hypothetical protein D0469_15370 [Peribacillus saganii]|uniref:Uncharacterized protein n=1 Tax=Peribacillus saganii TaxID=2303992 RepID=A0A372LMJ4_9BACI|nr:hypothetical protein [Peribacillus saganii]RFU67278.1 hypothetical protein D0469_15370 [Peribacillus saganii]
MNRPVLEYRLLKATEDYTALYHYEHIELEQIAARRECEFFVKEGVTYKQVSSAKEQKLYIIYVKIHEESPREPVDPAGIGTMKLEVRELDAIRNHPVIDSFYLDNHMQVLGVIGCTFHYFQGKEWERDSAEIDEDRRVYVLYVSPTGLTI